MNEIRRKAHRQRQEMGFALDLPISSLEVLNACAGATGLTHGHTDSPAPPEAAFQAAHHFAHVWLHDGKCRCDAADLNPNGSGESAALSKVDEDAPRNRPAKEASFFAAEMLLPGPLARKLFLEQQLPAEAIAALLGLPAPMVHRQLTDAILLPPLQNAPLKKAETPEPLDDSQQEAAQMPQGPLLLGAGPGTGKTKTLIGRCQYLTRTQGVPAEKILALTFSRQAAEEMRERLAHAGVGSMDAGPWIGTFHSFGLYVLRRYGERLGLPAEIRLLDTLDAVTLLENHLPSLQLNALDNLYNPAVHLGGILKQISRAKDELCPPERYAELCAAMERQAEQFAAEIAARPGKTLKKDTEATAHAQEQAAKALEVAHCYGIYETLLRNDGFLDFADLISRSVGLLETNPDIRAALQADFPHVLADEYQDVNRACARLVKLLAGEEARGLWAVGDHRQSIYRFRGASPANVAAFSRDYPGGRRLELKVNYRSRTPIVSLFGSAAQQMEAETGPALWQAQRGRAAETVFPAVTLATAPDEDGQADGIAQAIKALRASGQSYADQAILCRTHGQAEALAARLTARNIPTLYLGALLDRPEVKDMLCLLSLLVGEDGSGLLRVAAWPEYGAAQADILALLLRQETEKTPLISALQDSALPDGLRHLGKHLAELAAMEDNPARRLREYLFGLSHYLRHLYSGSSPLFMQTQQALAIHQLLGLAETFEQRLVVPEGRTAEPPNKIKAFLTHLRRMAAAGETLRGTAPPEAGALDAVRILTAHAAKGREYPVVFLPNLGAGQFPARGRHDGIPEPPGLADAAGQEADEEEFLFFVALSRARDYLILSRSESSAGRAIKPSPLLALLQPWFFAEGVAETLWPAGGASGEVAALPSPSPDTLPTYTSSALELYGRCPRQFYYERVLKLTGTITPGGYPLFHACVRRTLQWLEEEHAAGQVPDSEARKQKLEEVWAEYGPVGYLHEEKYRQSALGMLRAAAEAPRPGEKRTDAKMLHATLACCRVSVRPDVVRLAGDEGAMVIARQRTGRPGDEDKNDKRLALYRRAAQETHPGRPLRLELHYLTDGSVTEIEPPATPYKEKLEADRVAKYEAAAQGIGAGRFPAQRGDICQTCAFTLICPQ